MTLNLKTKKGSEFDHIAPSESLLSMMIDMGFDAADSAAALSATKNVGVQPAMDYIQAHPNCGKMGLSVEAPAPTSPSSSSTSHAAATSPSSRAAAASAAAAPPPLTSLIDTAARDALARKEQVEKAEKAKIEAKKKLIQKEKAKMQLRADKVMRKIKGMLAKPDALTEEAIHEVLKEAEEVFAVCPDDEMLNYVEKIKLHLHQEGGTKKAKTDGSSSSSSSAAAAMQDSDASCQIRIRLGDGSQILETFRASDTLRAVHRVVAARHGNINFEFVTPGPPSMRQVFAFAQLDHLTLTAAGLVPNGALTVQPFDKKDVIVEGGGSFHSTPAAAMPTMRGGRGGLRGPGMGGMGGMGGPALGMFGGGRNGPRGMMLGGAARGGHHEEDEGEGEGDGDEEEEEEGVFQHRSGHAWGSGGQTLSGNTVDDLGVGISPADAPDTDCSICFENLKLDADRPLRRLPCSHVFHRDCIGKWLPTHHKCPYCKSAC